jgi:hypothetical protein
VSQAREVAVQIDAAGVATLEGAPSASEPSAVVGQRVRVDHGKDDEPGSSQQLARLVEDSSAHEFEQRNRADNLHAVDQARQKDRVAIGDSEFEGRDGTAFDRPSGDPSPRSTTSSERGPRLFESLDVGIFMPRAREKAHEVTIACDFRFTTFT